MRSLLLRGWSPIGGAILATLLISACGPFLPPATQLPSGAPSGVPGAAVGNSSDVLAGTALTAAMSPLQKAATFTTTVTLDGKVAATTSGRSIGANVTMTVTSQGKSIDYLEVPPKAWARQAGSTWVLITSSQVPQSPIAILATPSTVTLADPGTLPSLLPGASTGASEGPSPSELASVASSSVAPSSRRAASASSPSASPSASPAASPSAAASPRALTILQASYPAAALGLQGDPVPVKITIDGSVVTFQYTSDAGGHKTTSVTALKPGATTPAIGAPKP